MKTLVILVLGVLACVVVHASEYSTVHLALINFSMFLSDAKAFFLLFILHVIVIVRTYSLKMVDFTRRKAMFNVTQFYCILAIDMMYLFHTFDVIAYFVKPPRHKLSIFIMCPLKMDFYGLYL